ncbi:ovalbumin-related protein X [Dermacentor silvarum]|uniref:ovalbumin-related protein X n=1 Tax=Dermacentor silvarum TaxID=543639 RepID=UPI0018992C28|nr:ovalbumin-related protein X [Dermacentor silvarum]
MSSTALGQPAAEPKNTMSGPRVQTQLQATRARLATRDLRIAHSAMCVRFAVADHLDHNVLLCPAAVAASLLASQACAVGDTHQQLVELLVKAGGKLEHLQEATLNALEAIEGDTANAEAALAYRMFVSRNLEVSEDCEQQLKSQLRCAVDRVSFHASSPEEVAEEVNGAFADGNPLIGEVLAPDAVDPAAKMVVASAFHYRGLLEPPFTRNPAKRRFRLRQDTYEILEFERSAGRFMHAEIEDPVATKVLELPYRGGTASLLLLLPDRSRRLNDLRAKLTPAFLAKLSGCLKPRDVRVEMPLVRIETRYSLNRTLIHAGVKQAFMPSAAFTNLVPAAEVRLGDLLHKATLVLDEGGPAPTLPYDKLSKEEKLRVSILPSVRPADVQFELIRPFIFVLRKTDDGCILLVGVVKDLKMLQ